MSFRNIHRYENFLVKPNLSSSIASVRMTQMQKEKGWQEVVNAISLTLPAVRPCVELSSCDKGVQTVLEDHGVIFTTSDYMTHIYDRCQTKNLKALQEGWGEINEWRIKILQKWEKVRVFIKLTIFSINFLLF
jgi:hypothetical protein